MNEGEFTRAEALYDQIRGDDPRILAIRSRAVDRIERATGYRAADVGSFGLELNLPDSDLDLAIGVPPSDLLRVLDALTARYSYKGERVSSATTSRHVFCFEQDGIEIDVGVLPDRDLAALEEGLDRCRRQMTRLEKVEHVWHKHRLKQAGEEQAYARLKLESYAKYCPTFLWQPIVVAA